MTDPIVPSSEERPVSDVLRRILRYGIVLCVVLGVGGAIVGGTVAGGPGVAGAIAGALLSLVLVNLTPLSIIVANRFASSAAYLQAFFGIVLGVWLLKFVVLIVALVILRGQPGVDGVVLFVTLAVGLVGGLAVDTITVLRSRVPVTER